MTSSSSDPRPAKLSTQGPGKKWSVKVDFNPTSLKYTVKNTLPNQSGDDKKKQNAGQSSAQLSMDLVFDSTDTGMDVREKTSQIALMMRPLKKKKVPPNVEFKWGVYRFVGFAESYTETLDFFSHDGVPLRATISLTLAQKEKVFSQEGKADKQASRTSDPVEFQPTPVDDATSVATKGGDPNAGRRIAEENGLESMRDTGGEALLADDEIEIGAPVAFAAGVAGAGISAAAGAAAGGGAGFAAEAGAGATASADITAGADLASGLEAGMAAGMDGGLNADATVGLSVGAGASFGGAASAGVAASEGAFAGLRAPKLTRQVGIQADELIESSESLQYGTAGEASVEVGGRARATGSIGLGANVHATEGLTSRIEFED